MTITQAQLAVDLGLDLCGEASPDRELALSSQPVIQPQSIQELLRESSRGKDLDRSLMTGTSASKAVCTLSTQADRYCIIGCRTVMFCPLCLNHILGFIL